MVAARLVDARKDYGRLETKLPSFLLAGSSHRGVGPVSLELARGEAVAVVGANGAGKSTLLRLVGGLASPTSGTVERHGRIGRLLDLGAGFLDDCTGAENARIALSIGGSAHGRSLDRVTEFAGLGSFFEEPVRTYSLGMRLRLAYALVVAESPDVLVVDEVLAVGDEAFQRRCMTYMEAFLEDGHTLLLATHNLYVAEKICGRALWLEEGRVKSLGPSSEVVRAYRDSLGRRSPRAPESAKGQEHGVVAGRLRSEPERPVYGEPWEIHVEWPATARGWIEVRSAADALVARIPVSGAGRAALCSCPLLAGEYGMALVSADSETPACEIEVTVGGGGRELGSVGLRRTWHGRGATS